MSFSALQRAENSSIQRARALLEAPVGGFSALQRAENSSILYWMEVQSGSLWVSVLFSEPKIPQSLNTIFGSDAIRGFSALQRAENSSIVSQLDADGRIGRFQCSSASRKFLNFIGHIHPVGAIQFQCSSASRKFLNRLRHHDRVSALAVSVLFSEPKIPQ